MSASHLSKAASIMGRKGGTVVTEYKLSVLKKNIKKAAGKKKGKKYPGSRGKKKIQEVDRPPIPSSSELSLVAREMGRKGGLSKSPAKAEAAKLNARGGPNGKGKKAGRRPKYHFTLKTKALIGVRVRRPCIIPDEVVANFKAFNGKTFPAFYKDKYGEKKRANVSIVSRNKKEIILKQSYTKKK